jgi:hypothetical protein
VEHVAQKFCDENYERFRLSRETYFSGCVRPIMTRVESETAQFISVLETLFPLFTNLLSLSFSYLQVILTINGAGVAFDVNTQDFLSTKSLATEYCFELHRHDDACINLLTSRLNEEVNASRNRGR